MLYEVITSTLIFRQPNKIYQLLGTEIEGISLAVQRNTELFKLDQKCVIHSSESITKLRIRELLVYRITSYNVCYTKLLRSTVYKTRYFNRVKIYISCCYILQI